jgi:hypothetical protein
MEDMVDMLLALDMRRPEGKQGKQEEQPQILKYKDLLVLEVYHNMEFH